MTSTAAAVLMDRLGLTEDELCAVLDVDPLTVIAGDLDDKPQLPILLALTGEAAERVGEDVLRRWLRATGPGGRPLDHLLARDYGAFEDDLATLAERGFVLRGEASGARSARRRCGRRRAATGGATVRAWAPEGAATWRARGRERGRGGDGASARGRRRDAPSAATRGPRGRTPARRDPATRPPHRARRGETLRAVRLRALADAPLAFGSTHAREAAYPPERWRDWAEASSAGGGQAFFFAVDETPGAPVGLASGVIWEADAETAHLYAMWVAPEARGRRSGRGARRRGRRVGGRARGRARAHRGHGRQRRRGAPLRARRLPRHRPSAGRSATRTPGRHCSSGRCPADPSREDAPRGATPRRRPLPRHRTRGRYRATSAATAPPRPLPHRPRPPGSSPGASRPARHPVRCRNPSAPRRSTAARVTRNVTPCDRGGRDDLRPRGVLRRRLRRLLLVEDAPDGVEHLLAEDARRRSRGRCRTACRRSS